jgi:alanyl-tRNA synthetase
MKSSQIRRHFLDFFEKEAHQIMDSAPIVVKNDPTLMFTNAGMNRFKDVFLGNEPASHPRVADTQKCLRVSGKHNDLEEVGVDTYHHTMFEMLGNWSFGDYYKKEAIAWAWKLLTEVYKIDKSRIYVTIFKGDADDKLEYDQEAYDFWKEHIEENRIIAASKKDNFWEMGDVGPCGPCSEIHVDMRSDEERKSQDGKALVNADHPEVIEIWNLVFMEMRRKADGTLVELDHKHIDTGMGLERLCMVLQGKGSTYDTDLFGGLIQLIEEKTGAKYTGGESKKDISIRVMADHIRAVAFTIADGQMPSNTGPGYVIRRILRRASRYAYSFLGAKEPIMYLLAEKLIEEMGSFFRELEVNKTLIVQAVKEEEESFLRTLDKGIALIEDIVSKSKSDEIDGEVVFELYDTFGFPVDLTALILAENGKTYNHDDFEKALNAQKERSRKAGAMETDDWVILNESSEVTRFIGYDQLEAEVKLLRYRKVIQKKKELYQLVFDQTPFYPEGGGQVGDKGLIENDSVKLPIINTFRENNLIVHLTTKSPQGLPTEYRAKVEFPRRALTASNHSATHLLHHALRNVLGKHVAQKGSLVEKDYLRFDFSHYSKVSDEELRKIEKEVNAMIRANMPLNEMRDTPIDQAMEMGAIALFGEKYGDSVRVIQFGDSVELCGGTHVQHTGDIGFFRIVSEGSVASGVRRIEAITSEAAEDYIFEQIDLVNGVKSLQKSPQNPLKSIESLLDEQAKLQKDLEELKKSKAVAIKKELMANAEKVNGINFISGEVDLDNASIKDISFQLRNEVAPLFLVLATSEKTKATITVALSDDLTSSYHAGKLVKELSSLIRGGGGGQAFFATAGGKDPNGIPSALERAKKILSDS